jgi:hypothetical protein
MSCQSLNALVKEANDGRDLADFKIAAIEVWHEWIFSAEGIRGPQPKWVTTTNTQPYLPRQITPVPNLLLAGAHTKTEVDVWSIEGAVESGRRAAQAIDPGVKILPQFKPLWLRVISLIDDTCYAAGAPHVLDLFGVGCLVVSVGTLALWFYYLAQHR